MSDIPEISAIEDLLYQHPLAALQECRQLLNRWRIGNNPQGFVEAASLLALIEDQIGDHAGARSELLQALSWCRQFGLQRFEPVIHERLGREYYTAGEFRLAAEHWLASFDQSQLAGNQPRELGLACIGLGHCCSAIGELALATTFHREAMRLLPPLQQTYLTAKAAISLGWDLRCSGAAAEASAILKNALALCQQTGFLFFQAEILLRLAELAVDQEEFAEAEQLAEDGLAMLVRSPSHWCEAKLLGLLATLHLRDDNLQLALNLVQHGLRIAEADRMTYVEAELCQIAARIGQAQGQPALSQLYLERAGHLQQANSGNWQAEPELLNALHARASQIPA
ncbi:hypothetical protein [Chitinilyticum piscinae]|uniref:MalT-like TPR region domain-containing protein n=1 Tax=Chitinilyticum piscinae TaxID=2866724 RepID=A0A8J7FN77_9NEIS|nr:hypothetical protein [Chitinilyticum piscinae]MBE9609239.1 hypothetical protein [Chitinilyticum piscinae]